MEKKSQTVLVIAPHPDDETLGCGGTLLRHQKNGDSIHWMIVTEMTASGQYSANDMTKRSQQIQQVAHAYQMKGVHFAELPTTQLDEIPTRQIVDKFSAIIKKVSPDCLYVPNRSDVHTDHQITFDAAIACSKWFRYPSIKSIYAYETLSETDFNLNPDSPAFRPQLFVNITDQIEKKIEILKIYAEEIKEFPFPRSEKSVRALATLRGAASGCEAAEAFMVLKEIR